MLLITMKKWLVPGRNMSADAAESFKALIEQHGFVTRLPLGQAIERIHKHQKGFNATNILAVEYGLLSVCEIDDLTDAQICMAGVAVVEELKQYPE
jgi:hypothetical protein